MAAGLSELDGIFTFKGDQRTALKAFPGGKDVFTLIQAGFKKGFVAAGP